MSKFEDPVIISNSISGVIANRDQCPAIPYTPEEYAAEARRSVDEGASQIHIHARTPDGTPSYEIEDFQAITEAIKAECPEVIINYSTGAIGVPIEKRIAYLEACRPDVAALNMSSMNYAKYSKRRKDFVFKAVFENSFDTIVEFITAMNDLGIKPEHECFDAGHVANLDPLYDMELIKPPSQISLVMGVTGGIRPTPRNVAVMADQVPGGPEGPNNWQVIGISRDQWKLLASSLVLGGNVRAGLEDNLYLPDGDVGHDGTTRLLGGPAFGDHGRFNPGDGIGMGYEDLKAIEAYNFLQSIVDGMQRAPSFADALHVAEVQTALIRSWES
ncbi:MAG TPA: 3-keto-5-aminohexanoate cleavage protein, partial [Solirubrobacterales bacterium]|nr:3-keto-5-aminohexanoate cleavage protein [Solirubrobacterales bacterium]